MQPTTAGSAPAPYLARHDPLGRTTVLADAVRTGGRLGVVSSTLTAGSGRSRLRFAEADVAYLVVDGTVEVQVDSHAWTLQALGLVHCPRGTAHSLRARTDSRLVVVTVPAGVEPFVAACDDADPALLLALAQEHHVDVLPDFLP
jgi:quercetin dioxygenase-like cupin family protein